MKGDEKKKSFLRPRCEIAVKNSSFYFNCVCHIDFRRFFRCMSQDNIKAFLYYVLRCTMGQLYSGGYHPSKLLDFAKSQIAEEN